LPLYLSLREEMCVMCSMLRNWRKNRTRWNTRSCWAHAFSMEALYSCYIWRATSFWRWI